MNELICRSQAGPCQFVITSFQVRNVAEIRGIRSEYEELWFAREGSSASIQFVYKVGAATGWTSGLVTSVLDQLDVNANGLGRVHFAGPILEITRSDGRLFADKGDSGSTVLDRDGKAVGVVFATSDRLAYAFPIRTVLAAWPEYSLE